MKRPVETTLNESQAGYIVFNHLRTEYKRGVFIDRKIIRDEVNDEYMKQSSMNHPSIKKYNDYLFNNVISKLYHDKIIVISADRKKISHTIQDPKPYIEVDVNKFKWDTKVTMESVFNFCGNNKFLIPSFQRMTAWTASKNYYELAYSIFNSTPLGMMYFWKISI